jgi:hypothetical protein
MNELVLKKFRWSCFDEQPWADLDWFQDVILEAYFNDCETRTVPKFDSIREDQGIEEEIKLPISAYYAFGNPNEWRYYESEKTQHFLDVYEDTFCDVENDVVGMLYENSLFLHHYDNIYFHMPMVQVW